MGEMKLPFEPENRKFTQVRKDQYDLSFERWESMGRPRVGEQATIGPRKPKGMLSSITEQGIKDSPDALAIASRAAAMAMTTKGVGLALGAVGRGIATQYARIRPLAERGYVGVVNTLVRNVEVVANLDKYRRLIGGLSASAGAAQGFSSFGTPASASQDETPTDPLMSSNDALMSSSNVFPPNEFDSQPKP